MNRTEPDRPSDPSRAASPGRPHGRGRARLTPAELRRRRSRSIAIAVVLGFMVLLFYAVTIVKLGPQVLVRTI